ncbi:MAG: indole-3-glycerol-phosphate synthase [bacterium]|nr:indole-3-glycerol-phosphate synthase [bacterium]MDT8365415.1 indole-3-glycerol-phosphate synthase [bacterium]
MPNAFSRAVLGARENGRFPLVADIKPVSPRDGALVGSRDPVALAKILEQAGVCALSVVTEAQHFGGSLQMLQDIAAAVSLPVLRKDFLRSPEDVDQSLEAGAAAVLLTLSTVSELESPGLYRRIVSLGMEPLVEVHTLEELHFSLGLNPLPTIIGINNRDITRLEKDDGDVGITEALAPLVPDGMAILSESAMLTPGDVSRAFAAGAHGVLIGTAVLQAADPAAVVVQLARGLGS